VLIGICIHQGGIGHPFLLRCQHKDVRTAGRINTINKGPPTSNIQTLYNEGISSRELFLPEIIVPTCANMFPNEVDPSKLPGQTFFWPGRK
jgi:hypothetical protein